VSLREHVEGVWAGDIIPQLCDYIRIPCLSADFDPDWKANGHIDRAVVQIRDWCAARTIDGLSVDVLELPGRTPVIVAEVQAFNGGDPNDTVLLYGHLDKQPEMTGWRDDLGPWKPVVEGDRLYGRGGADDGYSAFASLLAIEAAQAAGFPHTRLIVLIEASEESGSPDLPAYLEAMHDRIGSPTLVLCLDSGCLDHERMWVTTSLRGMAAMVLRVDVLTEGVHSGEASGVAPPVPHRPCPARPHRGQRHRAPSAAGVVHRGAPRPPGAGRGDRGRVPDPRPLPVGRRHLADGRRPGRPAAPPHMDAHVERHRRRRAAAHQSGRQRAAPVHLAEAQLPPAADVRPEAGLRRGA
jgi:hypothetical protein